MNVYFVCSETLSVTVPILDDGTGPKEDYVIYELVAARSRSQAKWLAWRTDADSFSGDIRDMPKFSVRVARKDIDAAAGIVSKSPEFEAIWADLPGATPEPPDETIHHRIDLWHLGAGQGKPLHDFLGLTWEQYAAWAACRMTDGEAVALIRTRSNAEATAPEALGGP